MDRTGEPLAVTGFAWPGVGTVVVVTHAETFGGGSLKSNGARGLSQLNDPGGASGVWSRVEDQWIARHADARTAAATNAAPGK